MVDSHGWTPVRYACQQNPAVVTKTRTARHLHRAGTRETIRRQMTFDWNHRIIRRHHTAHAPSLSISRPVLFGNQIQITCQRCSIPVKWVRRNTCSYWQRWNFYSRRNPALDTAFPLRRCLSHSAAESPVDPAQFGSHPALSSIARMGCDQDGQSAGWRKSNDIRPQTTGAPVGARRFHPVAKAPRPA